VNQRSTNPVLTRWVQSVRDLGNVRYPITDEILNSIKPLSQEDIMSDTLTPSQWRFAPVGVSTNELRARIRKIQAINWARAIRQPVVRWRLPVPALKTVHKQVTDTFYDMYDHHLYFYFTEGAPAALWSENPNPPMGIANGKECRLHSLTLPPERLDAFRRRWNLAEPGEIVELEEPPIAVNVEMLPDLDCKIVYNESHTSVPGKLVICILCKATQKTDAEFRVGKKKKVTYYHFGQQLMFASTLHKLQGSTLPKKRANTRYH
jgi:hypothetical protein